jgi:hypothetical protein
MVTRSLIIVAAACAACATVTFTRTASAEGEPRTADRPAETAAGEVPARSGSAPAAAAKPDAAKPAATKAPATKSNAPPRSPRVLFITAKDCEACDDELERLQKSGGDFDLMQKRGWKIGAGHENHIQIVDKDSIPDLIKKLNVHEFPTVACIQDGEIIRSFKDGCSTKLDAWTFSWLIKGFNERPTAPIPEAIRVEWTGSYPLRGNHWSVDGDWNPSKDVLIGHLRGAVHGGQIAASYKIEAWSYEELRSLHDDLHEREMGGVVPAGYTGYGGYQAQPTRGADNFSAGRKMSGL